MRINHNISAKISNVNLKRADTRTASALERLSSGYKINKASDDSSGMAISNRMRAQINALDQASRNSEDSQCIIQTAEGALAEIEALIQRMRELSVQAANDVYTIEDRDAAQKEINDLMDEVDRIASTTEFNGHGLLDGTLTRVVTYSENGFSSLSVSSEVKSGVYQVVVNQTAKPAQDSISYTIPAEGTSTICINEASITIEPTDTHASVKQKVVDVCDKLGINVTDNGPGNAFDLTTDANGKSQFIQVQEAGQPPKPIVRGADADVTAVVGAGSGFAAPTCVYDGNNVTILDNSGFKMQFAIEDSVTLGNTVDMTVYDTGSMLVQIGANEHQDVSIDFMEVSCRTLKFRESDGTNLINVCSQEGAGRAISVFDDAIRSVSSARSTLGAYQNRLDSTMSSLDVSVENLTDAMSRIRDTDMAAEMTDYTQMSVLSQAATSMLAQANNRSQQVMSLLQS